MSADKLQAKAGSYSPLAGLARSKTQPTVATLLNIHTAPRQPGSTVLFSSKEGMQDLEGSASAI